MRNEKCFTLIELLIVVGIIVALAAVIIPLVIQFAGKGDEGSRAAEEATFQTAVDAFMTDHSLVALPIPWAAKDIVDNTYAAAGPMTFGLTALNDPGAHADAVNAGHAMVDYIRDLPTECEYTVSVAGLVAQAVAAGDICEP